MDGSILLLTTSLAVGGTERHIAQIAPRLKRQGFDVAIYCFLNAGELAPGVREAGVEVLAPPHHADGPRGPAAVWSPSTVAAGCWGALGALRRRRPSIAHFFLPLPYIAGATAAAMASTPIRIMSRRSLNTYQSKYPGAAALERRLHRRMDRILANSRRVLLQLQNEEGVPPERLRLVYNGVDLDRYMSPSGRASARVRLELPDDALVLVTIANLISYKGHLDLLHALASVRVRLPEPWRLLIVGRDDGARGEIMAAIEALQLAGNVRLLGVRHDVPELLAAADLAVLASHQEGFSNAVIEAMAAGRPQVVTDVGGNAEAVFDGACGLVVPPHDPPALGAAILRLAGDPDLRDHLGVAARARAVEAFSMEACVKGYADIYHELLQRG